jgi:hypothetical protein
MPTLGPMIALARAGLVPLSSNFCMAWQIEELGTKRRSRAPADAASLKRLLRPQAAWHRVFAERFPSSVCA